MTLIQTALAIGLHAFAANPAPDDACRDVQVEELRGVASRNQRTVGNCYAHATALFLDFELNRGTSGEPPPGRSISPLYVALRMMKSYSSPSLGEASPQRAIEGAFTEHVVSILLTDKSACSVEKMNLALRGIAGLGRPFGAASTVGQHDQESAVAAAVDSLLRRRIDTCTHRETAMGGLSEVTDLMNEVTAALDSDGGPGAGKCEAVVAATPLSSLFFSENCQDMANRLLELLGRFGCKDDVKLDRSPFYGIIHMDSPKSGNVIWTPEAALNSGSPVLMGGCWREIGPEDLEDPSQCGPHAFILEAMRPNREKGTCEFRIKNSWGGAGERWVSRDALQRAASAPPRSSAFFHFPSWKLKELEQNKGILQKLRSFISQ